jgi:hypothetical protein
MISCTRRTRKVTKRLQASVYMRQHRTKAKKKKKKAENGSTKTDKQHADPRKVMTADNKKLMPKPLQQRPKKKEVHPNKVSTSHTNTPQAKDNA